MILCFSEIVGIGLCSVFAVLLWCVFCCLCCVSSGGVLGVLRWGVLGSVLGCVLVAPEQSVSVFPVFFRLAVVVFVVVWNVENSVDNFSSACVCTLS